MAEYLVRYSRDFWLLVEAEDSESAIEQADMAPDDDWEYSESGYEVEGPTS